MSATQDDASIAAPASGALPASDSPPAPGPATPPESARDTLLVPVPALSRAARRSGRRSTRVLSVMSLTAAVAITGFVLGTAARSSAPASPIAEATAGAWEATGALSDALRALRPGASRNPARALVKRAAGSVEDAGKRVETLKLPISDTPLRARVLRTLRADAEWIAAVGSTLANPRSPRRAELSGLAKRAANGVALVAVDVAGAKSSVGGTGRLLSATKSP